MGIGGYIKRLWHSRGHGVHSPLGYRLATQVLREPGRTYAYYSYTRLQGMPHGRTLRLAVRLVSEFKPTAVELAGSHPKALEQAVLLADSRISVIHSPQASCGGWTMRLLDSHGTLLATLACGNHLNLCSVPPGMAFGDGKAILTVHRPDLPRTFTPTIIAHD